jgi:hypothetical protein
MTASLVAMRWIVLLPLVSGCSLIVDESFSGEDAGGSGEDAAGSGEDAGSSVSVVNVVSTTGAQADVFSLNIAIPSETEVLVAMITYESDPSDVTPNLIADATLRNSLQALQLLGVTPSTNAARTEAWFLPTPPAGNAVLDMRAPAPISAAVLGAFCLHGVDPAQPLRLEAASGEAATIAEELPAVDGLYVAAIAVVPGDAVGEITLLTEVPVAWNLAAGSAPYGVSSLGFTLPGHQSQVDATLQFDTLMPAPWSLAAVAVPVAASP